MGASFGGGSKKKNASSTPSINITPLVDVVLVVLIIFMIVTPMVTKTFWLNLPPKDDKQEPAPPSDNKPLVMTVDKAGVIRVNTTVIAKNEVRDRVPRMLAAKDQKVLYFDAANDASYAAAIEAMDLSRAGGVKSIAILTESVLK
ncbi:MAG TPA: biopolymer transporter ExbD [Polyangiaceae bacterium]|nr:biopolymer transporter ExbD [Polyangiaceae bacterium]